MKILIKNGLVVTVNKNDEIKKMDILIENDEIKFLGNYNGPYDKLINAENKVIMPGLINTHTHLGMSIFRGTSDGLPLMSWLNDKIWPIEDKLTSKDIYYSNLISCIEMIKTGTTMCNDMYFGVDEGIKAIIESKIRCVYTRCLNDPDEFGDRKIEEFLEMYNKYKDTNPLITFSVAPHSMYTCSYNYLEKLKKIADKNNLLIHIHSSENLEEMNTIKEKYNMTPIELLNKLGYLNNKLVIAHGTYITDNDILLLKNKNVSISHNPISNLNLGCGVAPIKKLIDNNINVSLGTDGQGSGNNLNMFNHMGYVDLIQKGFNQNAKALDAYEVIKMATINGAKALNVDNIVGSIEIGKKADIIILDMNNIEIYPTVNLIFDIVHNVSINNIETTIINGNILMENHKLLLDINIEEVKQNIEKILKKTGEK